MDALKWACHNLTAHYVCALAIMRVGYMDFPQSSAAIFSAHIAIDLYIALEMQDAGAMPSLPHSWFSGLLLFVYWQSTVVRAQIMCISQKVLRCSGTPQEEP